MSMFTTIQNDNQQMKQEIQQLKYENLQIKHDCIQIQKEYSSRSQIFNEKNWEQKAWKMKNNQAINCNANNNLNESYHKDYMPRVSSFNLK